MKKFIREYHRPKDWKTLSSQLSDPNIVAAPVMISAKPLAIYDQNFESAIDLSGMYLDYIKNENGMIEIGIMTTLQSIVESDILKSEKLDTLCEAARRAARINLRNLAVLGGILKDLSGPGELPITLLALNAFTIIRSDEKSRTISFSDFLDTGSTLEKGEIISAISFPSDPNRLVGLERVSRTPQDQEIVSVAISLERYSNKVSNGRVAISGASPSWRRFKSAEKLLNDQEMSESLAIQAGEAAAEEAQPKSDFRGSADYRKAMVAVLVKRAILNTRNQANSIPGGKQ